MVMDDELNILPISSHMKSITPVPSKVNSLHSFPFAFSLRVGVSRVIAVDCVLMCISLCSWKGLSVIFICGLM